MCFDTQTTSLSSLVFQDQGYLVKVVFCTNKEFLILFSQFKFRLSLKIITKIFKKNNFLFLMLNFLYNLKGGFIKPLQHPGLKRHENKGNGVCCGAYR